MSGVELIALRAQKCARVLAAFSAAVWLAGCASSPPARTTGSAPPPKFDPPPSFGSASASKVLKYVPNRLFDLSDVVRMQVRLGPGWALGVRATEFVPFFIGGYKATWLGIPGPRGRPKVPFPLGLDSSGGFGLGGGEYGAAEFGVCVHLFMIGFDVGFDPRELADFAAGWGGADISGDDF